MKTEKVYKVRKIDSKGRESIIEETLEGLISYFGYTLKVGKSWNNRINTNPKTIKSFISNLQKSYNEKEANCFNRTFVELV